MLEGEFDDLEVYWVKVKKRFSLSPEALNALLSTALNGYGLSFGRSFCGAVRRRRWGLFYYLSCLYYFDIQLKPSVIAS